MNLIYFITCRQVGMCKIGLSVDPVERLAKMQKHSPLPLELEATFPQPFGVTKQSRACAERRLHEKHRACHSHAEWFALTPEIEADIAAAKAGEFDPAALPVATMLTWTGFSRKQAA
jgi:hypothetical protein